jgi:hypothetical protein
LPVGAVGKVVNMACTHAREFRTAYSPRHVR